MSGNAGAAGRSDARRPFARREPIGFRIRLSDGLLIRQGYIDGTGSEEIAVWATRRAASKFIRERKGQCRAERRDSIFDIRAYRFEPVYAAHR